MRIKLLTLFIALCLFAALISWTDWRLLDMEHEQEQEHIEMLQITERMLRRYCTDEYH